MEEWGLACAKEWEDGTRRTQDLVRAVGLREERYNHNGKDMWGVLMVSASSRPVDLLVRHT